MKNIYFEVNISKAKLLSQTTLYSCIKIHLFNVYLCKEADHLLIVSEILLRNINNLLPTRVSICQLATVFPYLEITVFPYLEITDLTLVISVTTQVILIFIRNEFENSLLISPVIRFLAVLCDFCISFDLKVRSSCIIFSS